MASTYTTRKRLERQTAGENNNTWGGYLNSNTIDLVDEAFGVVCVAMTTAGDSTLTAQSGATDEGRRSQIFLTGAPTSNVRLFVPASQSFYLVRNKMTGTKKVTLTNTGGTNGVDFSGSGSGAEQGIVVSDGTNVREVSRTVSIGAFSAFTSAVITVVSDAPTDTTGGAIADHMLFLDASDTGALNKVLVTDFFKNVLANVSARTSVALADTLMVTDSDGSNIAGIATVQKIHNAAFGLTAKTSVGASDTFPMVDVDASNVAKKITYANLKTTVIADIVATQAVQETATSNVLFVTPGRQQFHPSANKVFIEYDNQGESGTIESSFNVTSLTDGGTGIATINYTTAFSSVGYVVQNTAMYPSYSADIWTFYNVLKEDADKATTSYKSTGTYNTSDTIGHFDLDYNWFTMQGDQ